MSVLALDKLSYHYGKYNNQVLKGVAASFDEDELVPIMGRSGAGKTTLLSLVYGLDTAAPWTTSCSPCRFPGSRAPTKGRCPSPVGQAGYRRDHYQTQGPADVGR
ncbi:ABC transporter, ATP-binding protein [Bifidobacterium actinocoloniiforme DSM 22766]|uniref:ABC transporter, ATP-binding protein n=1 Tax=Bifidobacterium actinocoloniiforme DSM 22766 TaxID=1437605 RepID=A0A086Z140_9BIFI|nr:ABC transporter, ATP-binding protein [Bifidobacterium actinocoloniiforme DSM 22766]